MKPDELERRLERQPFREIPAGWREEILGAAHAACPGTPSAARHGSRALWWRELLWPCPQAWAGLAAVWAVILFLNAASREPVRAVRTPRTTPGREALMAWKERERMLAELAGPPEPAEPPKPLAPRPRSDLAHGTAAA
jgi:hypothetical protein